ncbi:MAG: TatD family hydrolase, partial [Clostridia bacterium]|nr:TatD family hydrolase [Clostridia bacterium]
YGGMLTALGIHPNDGQALSDPAAALGEIKALLRDPASRAVALGEIGLDYHYDGTDKEKQKALFRAQMAMAERLSLPVVIHDRDAHGDCFDVVLEFPRVTGIFHSFSGSAEMARELTKRGYYISFSGTVSFKNAARIREVAASVPKDRLLIETDCPYLAPPPHRGKLNHSGYLPFTNAALAEAIGLSPEECAALTFENARRVFGIKKG